jgi:hypothetical protein
MPKERTIEELVSFILDHAEPVTAKTAREVNYIVGSFTDEIGDSFPLLCDRCFRRIYLSDGLRMKRKHPQALIVCLECLVKEVGG